MQIVNPTRVKRSFVQKLHARPEEVFPLLCPVRETEWVAGWEPLVVYTNSGVVEPDCIFVTSDNGTEPVWVVTEHDPERFRLEMIKMSPGQTVGKINITLALNEENQTDATVTYMYTALSDEGVKFVENYTDEFYDKFMRTWESTLNDYLGSIKDA